MKTLILIAAAVALAGCARTYYGRPLTTQAQAQQDIAQCQFTAKSRYAAAGATNPMFALMIPGAVKQCLLGKGYHAVKR